MGIDIGSISTKGVIIDEYDNIITSAYLYTEGNPIKAVKKVVSLLRKEIDMNKYQVVSVGTTGSARKLIGKMVDAVVIKNEITAQVVGTTKIYPEVKTILEIGGQDSKIISVNRGNIVDYAINTLCSAGTGTFISSIANKLGINLEDINDMAIKSKNKINIASRCSVFAQTDIINKIQAGYKKEDIMAGVCHSIALNYMNSVAKGKKIITPVVFNGGVSKNLAIVKSLQELTGEEIIVNKNAHLMGAFGMAMMARDSKIEKVFDFNIDNYNIEAKIANCGKCSNNCEIVAIYKNNKVIDYYGNKCQVGNVT